jgi:signal transduction histidine kinase
MFDARRIRQVLDHLVENAVKYSPDGGEVEMRVWSTGGAVHLTVADTGVGIPPQDLPHLFERFYRGTNVDDRRFAGLGLGLYLCRLIVEQHGGRIWATSDGHSKGSTLHLQLPDSPAPLFEPDVAHFLQDSPFAPPGPDSH